MTIREHSQRTLVHFPFFAIFALRHRSKRNFYKRRPLRPLVNCHCQWSGIVRAFFLSSFLLHTYLESTREILKSLVSLHGWLALHLPAAPMFVGAPFLESPGFIIFELQKPPILVSQVLLCQAWTLHFLTQCYPLCATSNSALYSISLRFCLLLSIHSLIRLYDGIVDKLHKCLQANIVSHNDGTTLGISTSCIKLWVSLHSQVCN